MTTRRLYRDTEHAMLGGVCAGIANRFDLDPTLVRVAVIALAVITLGTTVLLYLALWVIIPVEERTGRPTREDITGEFREAGNRVVEAGRIVRRAARQAADEISQLPSGGGRTAAAPEESDAQDESGGAGSTAGSSAPPVPPPPPPASPSPGGTASGSEHEDPSQDPSQRQEQEQL